MKVILTGSSGRVGRAISAALASHHEVVGIDLVPSPFTQIIGDVANAETLNRAMEGADAVIHSAGLHAPHVSTKTEHEFERVNVAGTEAVFASAQKHGLARFVFTSTTALYGNAISEGKCTWIDEAVQPQPKTIYHKTKLAAEDCLKSLANDNLSVRVIRMSRCFPEPAGLMAAYRLHRGVDVRDIADIHALSLNSKGGAWQSVIASASTPFKVSDCEALGTNAKDVIWARAPKLAKAFEDRRWSLPNSIDRVYDSAFAQSLMGWRAKHDWREILTQLDRGDPAVLPAQAS